MSNGISSYANTHNIMGGPGFDEPVAGLSKTYRAISTGFGDVKRDIQKSPPGREIAGVGLGSLAFFAALIALPKLMTHLPILGRDTFLAGTMRGLIGIAGAIFIGFGLCEVIKHGFTQKALDNTLADMGDVGNTIKAFLGDIDDAVTGGRIGETLDTVGDKLGVAYNKAADGVKAADDDLGNKPSEIVDNLETAGRGGTAFAWEGLKNHLGRVGEGFDDLIGHKRETEITPLSGEDLHNMLKVPLLPPPALNLGGK